jgi:DNA-binding cell septation regulator SpoVG
MQKTFIFVFLFLFLCVYHVFALEITNIDRNNNIYDITFNNVILVKGVVLKNIRNDSFVEMPEYKSKGKVYKQFVILQRNYKKYLADALKKNQISSKNVPITFKVNEFNKLKNHKNIAAFSSVIFDDTLEVKCRIMKSITGFWIAWPSVKENNKWVNNFIFLDLDLKDKIEENLLKLVN